MTPQRTSEARGRGNLQHRGGSMPLGNEVFNCRGSTGLPNKKGQRQERKGEGKAGGVLCWGSTKVTEGAHYLFGVGGC